VARSRVTDVIEKRIWSHAELPEVVKDILRSGWKDVMLLACCARARTARAGRNPSTWSTGWCGASPEGTPVERQELLSAIPPLLAEIKDGLAMISFDTRRSNELMKELQSCHIACLRGSAPPVPVGEPRVAEPPPVAAEVKAGVVHDDEFNVQALNMAVGTWLEWLGDDGQTLRGKLSWKSEVTGTYIFVNRKGMKIGEMSVADVADLLRGERGQILEQTDAH